METKNEFKVYLKDSKDTFIEVKIEHNKDTHRIEDIKVKLSEKNRILALKKLNDRHINFKNTSYTYAFQGFLASYQAKTQHELATLELNKNKENHHTPWQNFINLEYFHKHTDIADEIIEMKEMQKWASELQDLSTHFKSFESHINNAYGNHEDRLREIGNDFRKYQNDIKEAIDKLCEDLNNSRFSRFKKSELIKLKEKLENNYATMNKQLKSLLSSNNLKKSDVEYLLNIADRDIFTQSLGSFMREQMSLILDTGIKVAYKISDNRLRDVIKVPTLVAYLSDAKHLMMIKGESLVEGPKEVDTYSPISKSMLDAIIGHNGNAENSDDKARWFSITPYLEDFNSEEVDNVICLLTNKTLAENNRYNSYYYHFLVQPLKFVASIVEIAFSIIRALIVISLGIISAIFAYFPFIVSQINAIHELVNTIFSSSFFAPFTGIKKSSLDKYERTSKNNVSDDDHQKLLAKFDGGLGFCARLFLVLTPDWVSKFIHEFFASILKSIIKFFQDVKYLLFSTKDTSSVYQKVKFRRDMIGYLKSELIEEERQILKENYASVEYCSSNGVQSPLDVFYDVAVVLSNSVVNPMFRKSPGIATFYFALSFLTFGTFVLPASAFSWMGPVPTWLQGVANQISINFTGKSAYLGVTEQMIACFFGWKITFFSTEFVVELLEGDYELIKQIFKDPEEIVLGLAVLVGMGMALQYVPILPATINIPGLPPVPNIYAELINVFAEEAKTCAEGTIGLTSIEYGFLGLKFAMLMHSMLTGSNKLGCSDSQIEIVVGIGEKDFIRNFAIFCKEKAPQKPQDLLTQFIDSEIKEINFNYKQEDIDEVKRKLTTAILPNGSHEKCKNVAELINKKDDKKMALLEAIEMTKDKNIDLFFARGVFGSNNEAHIYYDHLNNLFDDYNNDVRNKGKDSQQIEQIEASLIDKHQYLDIFFNKYCYTSSNNFVRSLLFMFYPITVLVRAIKYSWAYINSKHSMQHQIYKNFCKDLVIFSEVVTPIARMAADFSMYISGVLRGVVYLVLTPILFFLVFPLNQLVAKIDSRCAYESFNDLFAQMDTMICTYITLHKLPENLPLVGFFHKAAKVSLVNSARVAGVNVDLAGASEKICESLNLYKK